MNARSLDSRTPRVRRYSSEVAGLYDLAPRDDVLAGGCPAEHRLVKAAVPNASLEPPMERRRRKLEHLRSKCFVVEGPIEQRLHHLPTIMHQGTISPGRYEDNTTSNACLLRPAALSSET